MTRMLADGPLGVTSACYTDPLGRDDGCHAETRSLLTARNATFVSGADGSVDDQLSVWSAGLVPYTIPPEGRWGVPGGPPAGHGPRGPKDWLVGTKSALPEVASRWADLEGARDYATAMVVVDEILEAIRTSKRGYQGTPYTEVSVLQIARSRGYTEEELAALLDMGNSVGDAKWYQTPVSDYARVQLRAVALKRWTFPTKDEPTGMVTPVDPKTGRRVGMATLLDRLAAGLTAAGGRIYFGHRVVFLQRAGRGGSVRLSFADGRSVVAGRVIVNAGKADVAAWGVTSLPIAGASRSFRAGLDAVYVAPSSKMYCWWADSWWMTKLRLTRGRGRLSHPLFSLRYHDGHVTCKDKAKLRGCRGALLVSYVLGDATGVRQSIWSHGFSRHPFSPLSASPANRVDLMTKAEARGRGGGAARARRRLLWASVLSGLRAAHAGMAAAAGVTAAELIPDPDACASAVWWDVGVHALSPYARAAGGRDWLRDYARPVGGVRVHLVNEAWAEDRGWAEASLRSAERVLYHHVRMRRPRWMEAVFHRSIVERWNGGTRP